MRARHAKARATASDIERQTARLLRALAEPGASARTTDIPRPGLLAVSAKRRVSASPAAISPPPPARISSRKTSRAGARRPDAPSSKSPQLVMRN